MSEIIHTNMDTQQEITSTSGRRSQRSNVGKLPARYLDSAENNSPVDIKRKKTKSDQLVPKEKIAAEAKPRLKQKKDTSAKKEKRVTLKVSFTNK